MEILGKIFGSVARVKIMRLFILSGGVAFENKDIVSRSRVNSAVVRKETALLASIGFIKKKKDGWIFNDAFIYAEQIENLIIGTDILDKNALINNFKKTGRIKFLVVAGKFLHDKEGSVDMLLVGDNIKRKMVENYVKKIEADIGCELTYAIFAVDEFVYRFNMHDKLVRDILDFSHEILIDSKELSTQTLKNS